MEWRNTARHAMSRPAGRHTGNSATRYFRWNNTLGRTIIVTSPAKVVYTGMNRIGHTPVVSYRVVVASPQS